MTLTYDQIEFSVLDGKDFAPVEADGTPKVYPTRGEAETVAMSSAPKAHAVKVRVTRTIYGTIVNVEAIERRKDA